LQESADNSTWAAVTDQSVIGNGSSNPMADIANGVWIKCNSGTIRDAIKSKANRLDYRGSKRYVRLVFALAGTPVATLMGSEAILLDPAQAGDTNMLPSISTGNDNG